MKKFVAVIMSAILTLSSGAVMAAVPSITCNAVCKPEEKTLSVSGKYEKGGMRVITLVVLPAADSISAFSYESVDITKNFVFYSKTNEDGDFGETIVLPKNLATNQYKIYAISGDMSSNDGFTYLNTEIADEILSKAVGKDYATFSQYIHDNAKSLGLDSTEYYDNLEFINAYFYNFMPKTGYKNVEFTNRYYKAYALAEYKKGAITFDKLIEDYGTKFEISYDEYKNLSAAEKTKLEAQINACDLTKTEFKAAYTSKLLLSKLLAADGYENLRILMLANKAELLLDMSRYNSLKNSYYENNVFQKVYQSNCTELAAFKSVFESEATVQYNQMVNADNKTYSSGSGGGGGGIKVPVATPAPNTVKTENKASLFADMSSHWAKTPVEYLADKNILSGDNGKFKPDNNITRAEFTKIIVEAFDIPTQGAAGFSDVNADAWYAKYVGGASVNGIVSGFNGNFLPNNNITREDICVIVGQCLKKKNIILSEKQTFGDESEISGYAAEFVESLAGAKIIQGYNGSFRPKGMATRAESSVIIYNVLKYIEGVTK